MPHLDKEYNIMLLRFHTEFHMNHFSKITDVISDIVVTTLMAGLGKMFGISSLKLGK